MSARQPAFTIRPADATDVSTLARHRAAMFADMGQLPPEQRPSMVDATAAYLRSGMPPQPGRDALELGRGIRRIVLHASKEGRRIYERLGFPATNEMRLTGEWSTGSRPMAKSPRQRAPAARRKIKKAAKAAARKRR